MDEEDLREAEDARKLQTADDFAGFGATQSHLAGRAGLMDLLKTEGETMGVKLLKRMGWREGQGIGPKVRRKAKLADDGSLGDDDSAGTHLFAPENPPMVAFVRKLGHKGLGFEGEARLDPGMRAENGSGIDSDQEDASDSFFGQRLGGNKEPKNKNKARRGGFGVGVLNDTGSDDEDPYSMGPQISYNRAIGGDKKKKKSKPADEKRLITGSSNPLLRTKPVFISKKASLAKSFRKCHDGRLPLDGFVLADGIANLSISPEKKYAPPEIPKDWKSSKRSSAEREVSNYRSTTDVAKASTLDPRARAELLGEAQLPGKSVFDWMTPEARARIAKLTGRADLPPALGEKAPKGYETSETQKRKDLWDLVPKLDKDVAIQALSRAVSGWMPYSEDESKRARYRTFLEVRAGLRDGLPDRLPGSTTDEWVTEMQEFARAAEVFKPISGVMASRFTSASSAPKRASDMPDTSTNDLLTRPPTKPEDPAEEAAKIGMFGPMTRSMLSFYPSRLLCKRFNVKPPAHVQLDPGEFPGAEESHDRSRYSSATRQAGSSSRLDLVSQDVMNELIMESGMGSRAMPMARDSEKPAHVEVREQIVIEPERNEALEKERPGEAVFKAIFGSDDEEE
jgi:G patch domain-containing protein 1